MHSAKINIKEDIIRVFVAKALSKKECRLYSALTLRIDDVTVVQWFP